MKDFLICSNQISTTVNIHVWSDESISFLQVLPNIHRWLFWWNCEMKNATPFFSLLFFLHKIPKFLLVINCFRSSFFVCILNKGTNIGWIFVFDFYAVRYKLQILMKGLFYLSWVIEYCWHLAWPKCFSWWRKSKMK